MYLLFVPGDRGLVASYNGMMCFPDRRGKIKEPGLYACEKTYERSHYYFVDGFRVATAMPTDADISAIISIYDLTEIRYIQVIKVGVDHFLYTVYSDNTFSIYAKDAKQVSYIPVVDRVSMFGRGNSSVACIYNDRLKKDVVRDMNSIFKHAILPKKITKFEETNDMLNAMTVVYTTFYNLDIIHQAKCKTITLYAGKYFVVDCYTLDYRGNEIPMKLRCIIVRNIKKVYEVVVIPEKYMDEDEIAGDMGLVFTARQIDDYMVDHYMGMGSMIDELLYNYVNVESDGIGVNYLNGCFALNGYSEYNVKRAEESVEEFKKYARKILAHPSKETIKLAPRLTVKNALKIGHPYSYSVVS
jgi:hypothetical protein